MRTVRQAVRDQPKWWRISAAAFTPTSVIVLREGYGWDHLRADALAGLTVAILALPLSMAIAIGCGVTPDKGLVTSIIAGFCISALGGTRFQIGGPAAAFIVVIATVIEKHGYDGLLTATLLAGLVLIIAGLMQLGSYIKYIPGPVILGFTSGLGILIALGQVKDFFGLKGVVAPDVVHRVADLWSQSGQIDPWSLSVGVATLLTIVALRRLDPRWPGLLIAVVAMSAACAIAELPVQTIGSRFGAIESALPTLHVPAFPLDKLPELMPVVFTLAFLIGIESLLSAVAADAIAGTRHRSNVEILAQGAANVASSLFGGLPATGVIARTGTNISAGARTPMAGILHSVFIVVFVVLLAPLAAFLALPCLAAVLLHTAWRLMDVADVTRFVQRAPWDDRVILLVTLFLTVLVDLSVAIAVGVVLASILFMHRMAELPGVHLAGGSLVEGDDDGGSRHHPAVITPEQVPAGVRIFQFQGPLFFGAARHIEAALGDLDAYPKVMILRLREVPLIDATAVSALDELGRSCTAQGTRIIITGLQPQPRAALHRFGFQRTHHVILAPNIFSALEKAKELLGEKAPG